ncbi:MAG: hypothetical protein ACKVRO_10670 [Micropepsaceae bacterium]
MPNAPLARTAAAALALAALTNCTSAGEPPPPPIEPPSPQASSCPVIESRDWAAWVNAMPGPGTAKELIATGQIVLPTPGYTVTLTAGLADRSATPMQQLILTATPPTGMVPQVLTTQPVRYQGPAISMNYRAIRIMCGGQMLSEIADVPVAQ